MINISDMRSRISIFFVLPHENWHNSAVCKNSKKWIAMKTRFHCWKGRLIYPQWFGRMTVACLWQWFTLSRPITIEWPCVFHLFSVYLVNMLFFGRSIFGFSKVKSRFIWSLWTIYFAFQSQTHWFWRYVFRFKTLFAQSYLSSDMLDVRKIHTHIVFIFRLSSCTTQFCSSLISFECISKLISTSTHFFWL